MVQSHQYIHKQRQVRSICKIIVFSKSEFRRRKRIHTHAEFLGTVTVIFFPSHLGISGKCTNLYSPRAIMHISQSEAQPAPSAQLRCLQKTLASQKTPLTEGGGDQSRGTLTGVSSHFFQRVLRKSVLTARGQEVSGKF